MRSFAFVGFGVVSWGAASNQPVGLFLFRPFATGLRAVVSTHVAVADAFKVCHVHAPGLDTVCTALALC
jgi:hypothetical protein